MGSHFTSCLSCASELVLLSPTIEGLNYILGIAECLSKQFSVEFNGEKACTSPLTGNMSRRETKLRYLFSMLTIKNMQYILVIFVMQRIKDTMLVAFQVVFTSNSTSSEVSLNGFQVTFKPSCSQLIVLLFMVWLCCHCVG